MTSRQPTHAEFEDDVLGFLAAHTSRRSNRKRVWGEGLDTVSIITEKSGDEELADLAAARHWRALQYDAGFGAITAPIDDGGRGLDASYERIYQRLENQFEIPAQTQLAVGLGMVAPTILVYGTPNQKSMYLTKLWRGEIVGCQLFSEPDAGSDLAGMQTRAAQSGGSWVLNGQKVWTSGAHYSQIGLLLARSDPGAPKHRGLTAFLLDMKTEGVDIRPLRQMTGGASFNEVFLTDVRIPDDRRLAEPGQGWQVIMTTLMNERAAIGSGVAESASAWERIADLARNLGRNADPVIRQQIANLYINERVASLNNARALAAVENGQPPGAVMSIAKLAFTQNLQHAAALAATLLGPLLVADTGEWGTYAWSDFVLGVPGLRLAGGTDEIMRNVLAERVLGLPKEPSS
jgi:acyl-CoA dehydrogenase